MADQDKFSRSAKRESSQILKDLNPKRKKPDDQQDEVVAVEGTVANKDPQAPSRDKVEDSFEYITLLPVSWSVYYKKPTSENEEEEEEDYDAADREENTHTDSNGVLVTPYRKPAKDFPLFKNIISREGGKQLNELMRLSGFCMPDDYSMHIYSDFYGEGIMRIMECQLRDFHQALHLGPPKLQQSWAILAALGHFLSWPGTADPWCHIGDGDRVTALANVLGVAFLTVLDEIELAGELDSQGDFKDLGLVMALYIRELGDHDVKRLSWNKEIVNYARRAGIDLATVGVIKFKGRMEEIEESEDVDSEDEEDSESDSDTEDEPESRAMTVEKWKWTKIFTAYENEYLSEDERTPFIKSRYNIVGWSRAERASQA